MGKWLIHNSELILTEDFHLTHNNRAFRYGDGFFESIRIKEGKAPLLSYHLQRIKLSAKIIHLSHLPDDEKITELINQLIKKNNEPNARLRITFYRDGKGLYTPEENKAAYLMEMTEMTGDAFGLNETGLTVGFYPERLKITNSPLSNIKTLSSANYVLASIHREKNNWDDCIILNSDDRPCEFYSANLFIVKDKKIITPPLSEGCVNGSFRLFLQDVLKDELIEKPLTRTDILQADELFLTSGIRGIHWIKQMEDKAYNCDQITELHIQLMESIGL